MKLTYWTHVIETGGTLLSIEIKSISINKPSAVVANIILSFLLFDQLFLTMVNANQPLFLLDKLEFGNGISKD